MPLKAEISDICTDQWKVEMFSAPCSSPHCCCFGCLCMPCASYQQRKKLLDITGENYVCFGGMCYGCPCIGQECNEMPWLCCEVVCCPILALDGNRFMIQTRFGVQNSACDDCILCCTCVLSCAADIARCFDCDFADELTLVADLLLCVVSGCMHAQQHIEIKNIENYQGMPAHILQAMDPKQAQLIQNAKCGQSMSAPSPQVMGVGASPQFQNFVVGQQVKLIADESQFRTAFARFQHDELNGWTPQKHNLRGEQCILTHVFDDRTVTAQFADASTLDFPFEALA